MPSFDPATAAAVAVALYFFLYRLQTVKSHPDEPPIIPSAVPFVGHLLGMALQGGRYIKQIGLCNRDKPIFTLPVPGSRIYVVTDPPLAAAVQRASKALSFTPLVPDITKRILGLDGATVAIVRQNLDPEPGDPRGFLADVHDSVYSSLGPGAELNTLSLAAATELANQLNAFSKDAFGDGDAVPTDNLLVWIRHFVAAGTARFLYGERNPISARPELEEAFWDFDHGLGGLLMGIAPSVTARKAYRGREALTAAFAEYLRSGYHEQEYGSADIVRRRVEVAERYGWTAEAMARSDVSFLFAGIVNTATTTFWTVLYLFSRRDLLGAVRAELAASMEGENKATLAVDALKTSCPTLVAVMRESLRLGSDNYSTRLVKTDTVLAGRHFVKANSVVQIAGGVMHADEGIWGGDAAEFDHKRFMGETKEKRGDDKTQPSEQEKGETRPSIHPAAFRAFGGGKTLCPGRHFATNEILALVAMIVLLFEVERPDGGPLEVPDKDDGVLPVHILEPKEAVRAVIRRGGVDEVRVV